MISDRHQCIFVHLRRTGGNSIEIALGGIVLLNKSGKPTTKWDNKLHRGANLPYKMDNRGHDYSHDTAQEIRRQHPENFHSYKSFSIIRNPWDQMISLYLRLHANDSNAIHFKHWLKNLKPTNMQGTVPSQSLFDENGQCLVDEIGRYENLADDFRNICEMFKISSAPLPRSNVSGKKHYANYYDRESASIVAEIFKKDRKYFGYRFERP